MKEWFEHQKGHINIDDEWIYLTSTGNWSETLNLPERTREAPNKKRKLGNSLVALFVLTSSISIVVSVASIRDGALRYPTLLIGIVVALWLFTKQENKPRFKISRARITKYDFKDGDVTIYFSNHLGEKHDITLEEIEMKGKVVFRSLNSQLERPIK